jgi:hypothetical protein
MPALHTIPDDIVESYAASTELRTFFEEGDISRTIASAAIHQP